MLRFAAVLLMAFCLATTTSAMSISEVGPPVGLPPEKYKGLQFIDSRGCLYIRTGTRKRADWVPRVTRKGDAICGLEPTFPVGSDAGVSQGN